MLKEKLELLPQQPGCYLMKNDRGEIIYVGKAKNLRNRVRSYFTGSHDAKTTRLVMDIVDFEYIVTSSDIEALLLESNLIKKHRPRYNILLKDDKSYPYIQLTKETHPRLLVTRKLVKDGSKYFGPYPNAGAAQQTKKLLDRLFPLRKCGKLPKRVCLYYHLGQCLAPCEFEVSEEKYAELTQKITRFLNRNYPELKQELTEQMQQASEALEFERAKELRDLIADIDTLMAEQHVSLVDDVDRDIFGYAVDKGYMCVQVFFIRQGKLLERNVSIFPHFQEPEEDFLSFVGQFYYDSPALPKEIVMPVGIDPKTVSVFVPERKIIIPQRGTKRKLLEMATENAQVALSERLQLMERDQSKTTLALTQLAEAIGMNVPKRIEAFDNSNIQGVDPVSAMVVFIDGKPAKREYRKYKIRTVTGADDYATIREVVRRRYTRVLRENLPLPDLILIDGGKGQLAAALDVLENELGLTIPVGGIAKNDKHQTAMLLMGEPPSEVPLARGSDGFYLLQRIQDEVHRFAITFHRQTRSKSFLHSVLDDIPGIGAKRKQRLFRHFGSLEKIKAATVEELQQAGLPVKLAEAVYQQWRVKKEE